jgi:plasmid stabilization system protein ParE
LLHELTYFAAIDPALAQRFDEAVQAAEARIIRAPNSGLAHRHGTRRVFAGKFKFSIVYLHLPGEIVVVAVAAFQRKPAYWLDRLTG